MWGGFRLFLLIPACILLILAGCVPIQPEAPASSEQLPVSSAPSSSQPPAEPTATAIQAPPATAVPDPSNPPISSDWQTFIDETRGLSISYPPGWIFVDPTKKELAELFEELGEKADSDEIRELLATSVQAIQQNDLFVGLGFQYTTDSSRDIRFVNNINAIYFHTEGLFLQLIAQMLAAQLDSMDGFVVDSAEVVAGLRPEGVEVASVRYRSEGALFNQPDMEIVGWQVGVLSPQAERIVVLTFSIRSEDFAELEPLLTEIVQRVQWLE